MRIYILIIIIIRVKRVNYSDGNHLQYGSWLPSLPSMMNFVFRCDEPNTFGRLAKQWASSASPWMTSVCNLMAFLFCQELLFILSSLKSVCLLSSKYMYMYTLLPVALEQSMTSSASYMYRMPNTYNNSVYSTCTYQ